MIYFFTAVLLLLMVMVVVSLLRGLNAYRKSLNSPDSSEDVQRALQLKQNQMMWARIRYQGLAIVVVVVLISITR